MSSRVPKYSSVPKSIAALMKRVTDGMSAGVTATKALGQEGRDNKSGGAVLLEALSTNFSVTVLKSAKSTLCMAAKVLG